MRADIAFGQYCEGRSVLHRLDPRVKIVISILFIVVIFMAKNIWAIALVTAAALALVPISGISPRIVLRGLKPIIFIAVFTAIINIFWVRGDTLLVHFGIVKIYLEGIINALMIVLRIVLLITATSVFMTYTTTPLALTDAIESLLSPLKKLHVPVHEFSMMMTIALRFIPTLIDETLKPALEAIEQASFRERNERAEAVDDVLPEMEKAQRELEDFAKQLEDRAAKVDAFEKAKDLAARQEALAKAAREITEERPLDTAKLEAWKRLEEAAMAQAEGSPKTSQCLPRA